MAMQIVLDSLSRCFTGSTRSGFRSAAHHGEEFSRTASGGRESVMRNGSSMSGASREIEGTPGAQRRNRGAIGMSLKDKEWDMLFENDPRQARAPSSGSGNRKRDGTASQRRQMPDMELEYAEVVAQARRAAHPTRHRTPSSRRRRSSCKPAEIFRFKSRSSKPTKAARSSKPKNTSISSILLGNDNAMSLCFATPIRDEEDEDGSVCTADEHTLNTCEDNTMTSTVLFESKYAHIKEKRPPMPLFKQYQVECTEEKTNELQRIIASESHKSKLSVIRLGTKKEKQSMAAKEDAGVENAVDPKIISDGNRDHDENATPSRQRPAPGSSPSTPPRHPSGGKKEIQVLAGASNDTKKMSRSPSDGNAPSLKLLSESSQSTTPSMDPSSEKSFLNTAAMI